MSIENESIPETLQRPEVTSWLWQVNALAMTNGQESTLSIMTAQAIVKRGGGLFAGGVAHYKAACEAFDQIVSSGVYEKVGAGLINLLGVAEILVRFANGEDV